MKSSFFDQFHNEILEEHQKFDTVMEDKELPPYKCDHKGKLSFVPGGLRCKCGAGWQGSQLNVIWDHFNKSV